MNRLITSGVLLVVTGLIMLVATGARASTTPAAQPDGHADQLQLAHVPGTHGRICHDHRGGNCWWEAAIVLDRRVRKGDGTVRAELHTVWQEYKGDFHDTWADDNAWWGILWMDAHARFGTASYAQEARTLWHWDQHHSWSAACGGAIRQHPGGSQDAIAEAVYGVLGHMVGQDASARRAAQWIYSHLQHSQASAPVAMAVNSSCKTDPVNKDEHPALGAEVMSYQAEKLYNIAGQDGARASAIAKYPDRVYDGVFNIEYQRYIGG